MSELMPVLITVVNVISLFAAMAMFGASLWIIVFQFKLLAARRSIPLESVIFMLIILWVFPMAVKDFPVRMLESFLVAVQDSRPIVEEIQTESLLWADLAIPTQPPDPIVVITRAPATVIVNPVDMPTLNAHTVTPEIFEPVATPTMLPISTPKPEPTATTDWNNWQPGQLAPTIAPQGG